MAKRGPIRRARARISTAWRQRAERKEDEREQVTRAANLILGVLLYIPEKKKAAMLKEMQKRTVFKKGVRTKKRAAAYRPYVRRMYFERGEKSTTTIMHEVMHYLKSKKAILCGDVTATAINEYGVLGRWPRAHQNRLFQQYKIERLEPSDLERYTAKEPEAYKVGRQFARHACDLNWKLKRGSAGIEWLALIAAGFHPKFAEQVVRAKEYHAVMRILTGEFAKKGKVTKRMVKRIASGFSESLAG